MAKRRAAIDVGRSFFMLLLGTVALAGAGCGGGGGGSDGPTDLCAGVTCVASDRCHVAGTCDAATGACSAETPKCIAPQECEAATGACVDPDLCAGVTCDANDLCHVAGTCNPTNGQCSAELEKCGAGQVCDLGTGTCSVADRCAGVTCQVSDACHVAGTCNPDTGACSPETPRCASDQVCDMGTGTCSAVDRCANVTCQASDACHVAGTCNPDTGACSPETPRCASDQVCDLGTGTCSALDRCAGVTCQVSDACHVAGTCNPDTGACSPETPKCASDQVCDMGTGTCSALDPCANVTCETSDLCHVAGTCNPDTGACSPETPKCASDQVCDLGTGTCGSPDLCSGVTCDAPPACHLQQGATCDRNTGACVYLVAEGNTCQGADRCVQGETCQPDGACGGGAPRQCDAPGACHTASGATCDPASGACAYPVDAGGSCGDDPCRVGQQCLADGTCSEGTPRCAEDQVCHADGTCSSPARIRAVSYAVKFASGIASGKDGAIYLTGQVANTGADVPPVDLGNGHTLEGSRAFVARLDTTELLPAWAVAYGSGAMGASNYQQNATTVAVAGTGQLGVAGKFNGFMELGGTIENYDTNEKAFVAAVDPGTGAALWGKKVDLGSGTTGALTAIAGHRSEGSFVVCGQVNAVWAVDLVPGAPSAPGGGADIVVAKLDARTGAVIWGKQFGGADSQYCNALAIDERGDVFIAGHYRKTLDFGLGALPTPSGRYGAYAAKLSGTDGAALGAAGFVAGAGTWAMAKALAIDPGGDVIIAGSFAGNNVPFGSFTLSNAGGDDAFVAKLRGANLGQVLWARRWGGPGTDDVKGLGVTSSGEVVAVGQAASTRTSGLIEFLPDPQTLTVPGSTGLDAIVVRLTGATGEVAFAQNYGDEYGQGASAVTVLGAPEAERDAVLVLGTFAGTIDFFGDPNHPELVLESGSVSTYHYFLVMMR